MFKLPLQTAISYGHLVWSFPNTKHLKIHQCLAASLKSVVTDMNAKEIKIKTRMSKFDGEGRWSKEWEDERSEEQNIC